uniref:hypothetical protein n=1 Tax=Anaplasma centrale TaxID=769 RepID=UPI001651105D|nr:hypothetical protein [Anaplasma centrale]
MLLKLRFLLIAGVFTWSILHGVPAGASAATGTGDAADDTAVPPLLFPNGPA